MTTFHRLLIGMALLAGFAVGCTGRNPLDAVVEPPTPINGSITVTTYNGAVTAGGVTITVTSFDGTSQTTVTASVIQAGTIVGQVIVPEPKAGTYKVILAGQPASSPFYQTVNLTVANPVANVNIQLVGAQLGVVSSDSKPQSFTGDSGVHSYIVSYANNSNANSDINIVVSNIPNGWSTNIPNAQLKVGQTTPFYVYNPGFSAVSPATITIVGYAGGVAVTQTTLTLTQNWGVGLTLSNTFDGSCHSNGAGGCGNTWPEAYYLATQTATWNMSSATLATLSPGALQTSYTISSITNNVCYPYASNIANPCASGLISPVLPYAGEAPFGARSSNLYLGFIPMAAGDSETLSGYFSVELNGAVLVFEHSFSYTNTWCGNSCDTTTSQSFF